MKTPPAPEGIPVGVTRTALGRRLSRAPPFTRKSGSFDTACAPSSSAAALLARSRISPAFRVSAEAATVSPSESRSPTPAV